MTQYVELPPPFSMSTLTSVVSSVRDNEEDSEVTPISGPAECGVKLLPHVCSRELVRSTAGLLSLEEVAMVKVLNESIVEGIVRDEL